MPLVRDEFVVVLVLGLNLNKVIEYDLGIASYTLAESFDTTFTPSGTN
jgi:hypothetical protein